MLELWHEARFREERYMALAVLGDRRYARFRTLEALPLYEELIVTGAWWDFVDEVATGPLGELLPGRSRRRCAQWSVDDDMWKRRASIIAQVRRKRETDFALLTDVHRAQPRGPRVLHPQGDRLGAARLRLGRARGRARLLRHP